MLRSISPTPVTHNVVNHIVTIITYIVTHIYLQTYNVDHGNCISQEDVMYWMANRV